MLEHLKLATKRPLDAADEGVGWRNQIDPNMLEELLDEAGKNTGAYMTRWIFGGEP